MIKITLFFLCLLLSFFSNAQNPSFAWANRIGGNASNYGTGMSLDASGNVYTTGYFQGTSDFNPGAAVLNLTSNGYEDIYITKMDASGNYIWAKTIGAANPDKGQSIAVDASGNVYITGTFELTVDFDPGAGIFNMTNTGSGVASFILKLDASGNFIWAKQIGGTSGRYAQGIKVDTSGNLYTVGYYYGTADFDPGVGSFNLTSSGGSADIFILKLTTSGNFSWVKTMGSTSADYGEEISLDASGNIYTTGSFQSMVDFDPGAGILNLGISGNTDQLFISKLDPSGNLIWAKSTNGGSCSGLSLTVDASNNVLATGAFQFTVDFDPGNGVFNMTNIGSYYNIFILKLDASGNFAWAKKFGTIYWEAGRSIVTDGYGNSYTTGDFRGTMDMDPGIGVYNLSSTINDFDVFILKLDPSGNFVWAKNTGARASGYAIAVNNLNDVYTLGNFGGTIDFNFDAGVFTLSSTGSSDIFIHKMYQAPCINPTLPSVTASFNTICTGQNVTIGIDTGSINSATAWKWYSSSCGGTLVGTGSSITVSPTSTTTYFVRGEGGCVSAGSCVSKTITVNPTPTVTASNAVGCAGSAMTLTGNPTGGIFSVSNPYLGNSTTYTYSYTNAFGCSSTSPPATITVNSLPALSVTVIPDDTICNGSQLTLNAQGASTYSWTNGQNTPANNIAFTPLASSTYTVTGVNANGCSSTSTIPIMVFNQIPTVTEGTRCGAGVVNLSASGSGALSWYSQSTGGSLLNTGNTFSPAVSSTTTYYVNNTQVMSTSNVISTLGPLNNSIGTGAQSTLAQWLTYNVLQACTLQSVVVYPGAAGNVILEQRNATGTVILNTTSIVVTPSQVGTAVTMILNWPFVPGNGYRIYRNTASVALYRNSTGGAYPYSNSSVSITGNSVSANNYWWAYNWTIMTPVVNYCTSTRVPVTATINPFPTVTVSNINACAGNAVSLVGHPAGGIYSQPNPYSGPSTSYTYTYTDTNGCTGISSSASITMDTCSLTLNLKLFLQGYYLGSGLMQPTLMNEGVIASSSITDAIIIELHESVPPYATASSTTTFLNTNGTASCTFHVPVGSYYIAIKHRNTIETWSSNPVVLSTSAATYDFTVADNQAYEENMKEVESGIWAFYSGDINLDDNIDLLDAPFLENDINAFYSGYYATDLNGDGNVDLLDLPMLEDNTTAFIFSAHP